MSASPLKTIRRKHRNLTPIWITVLLLAAGSPVVPGANALYFQDKNLNAGLEQGAAFARQLGAGEIHAYTLRLVAGQYAHVSIAQQGVNVIVTLSGSDGKVLATVNRRDFNQGIESVSFVAETTGDYRLEVRAGEGGEAGHYHIRVEEWRGATIQDKDRVAAERHLDEARRLKRRWWVEESLRAAAREAEESLLLCERAGDAEMEADSLLQLGSIYQFMSDSAKVIEYCDRALALSRAARDPFGEARALMILAKTRGRAISAMPSFVIPNRSGLNRFAACSMIGRRCSNT